MSEITLNGIVLNEFDYSDYDKIVTIYSDQLGKLSFIALGTRKAKSKNKYSINLFSYSNFVIFKSRLNTSLSKLKKGEIINTNISITSSWIKYLISSVIISIINDNTDFWQKDYKLFLILKNSLDEISNNKNNELLVLISFLFSYLKILNYKFYFNICYICNKKEQIVYLNLDNFKGFCIKCNKYNYETDKKIVDILNVLNLNNHYTIIAEYSKIIKHSYLIIICKMLLEFYEKNLGIYNFTISFFLKNKMFNNVKYLIDELYYIPI